MVVGLRGEIVHLKLPEFAAPDYSIIIGKFSVLVDRSRRGLCQGGPFVLPIFESNDQPIHP